MSDVPFTAWEQAVFVALFIVFCGGVFAALRWIITAIRNITDDFQKYVKSRDDQWQDFFQMLLNQQAQNEKIREDQFGNRNNALAEAIDRNTTALTGIQQYIVTSLAEMKAARQPRSTKG